ncbi:MAG: LL-diaminopimelate aminotransferase [Candidatus Tectomicrobia bacterium]|uniref:Aminotransferase n=1 Tax=Tectimicrobiota bacterium TaxID=2528274 RepID=A0A932I110_UNCTE|nr:LL-diaminopimelate aminotransferase [Candidatus Tectomicrobia bacterium]
MSVITVERAERLKRLPPYLFAMIDKMKRKAIEAGMDIISLGVGDPDLPTPGHIISELDQAARRPANHQYPSYEGMLSFRKGCADWYGKRFGVQLDPRTEVLSLIGSKEGIAHISLAFTNPGDYALVPDPAYPVYEIGTYFADGRPHFMPLREERGFLPDLGAVPTDVAKKAKLIFINYPNNPTAACAEVGFYREVVEFAKSHDLIVCSDNAYSEMSFDGYEPMSFLNAEGAKDVGVEFHSCSKTYNMTGWRIGFAVGNADVLAGLGAIKTNVDSGVFQAVQEAGLKALTADQSCVAAMRKTYQRRRDVMLEGLAELGLRANRPKATFYVWVKCPEGYTSMEFTAHLLKTCGVVTTPGVGFGKSGEGFVRMALTVEEPRLREAISRIKKAGFRR